MKILSILKTAFKSILSNKLRSALTMLGLIIGIASVIVLVGIGNGASTNVRSQVQSLGADIITVSVTSDTASFEYDSLDQILELDNVESIAPYKRLSGTATRGTTSTSNSTIMAVNNNYLNITNTTLAEGRTISIIDIENKSKVCIIGSDVAETLFSLADPLGETIKINGDKYTVIGVLEEQGTSMGNSIDDMILIPITTAKYLGESTDITSLYVKVADEDNISRTINLLENYIRQTLSISSDYFSVSSQDSVLDTMENVNNTLSLLLGGIASISLVVGGIGVMNVMLVSVTERTKEIGIRKSLGAKRRDILFQFLVEALALSILGGIIGVVIGLIIGNVLENFDFSFSPSQSIIFITRDSDGTISTNGNTNLNDIFQNASFDKTNLNSIYEITIENYSFRGINYQNQDGTYSQVLINVDSEKTIADQFIKNLVISFSITVAVILIASYILSKRTLKPIVESWKKQTQFVQDASHELRTPLTIIKAKQESLLENPNSKIIDNAEDISITLQETQRLTKLIKELMELAKNDADKIQLNRARFNLDNEIKSLITLYKDLATNEQKELTASFEFKEEINADLNMLKELLVILLDNSIKYTEPNDTIEVKTYKQDGKAVIEVADTGIGISKEAIDHIFERFYREEKSRNREKGGMGLGLSIAYNIVTLHKGTIKFDKNREKGAKVVVKLPIK